jgi:hypothetical protein
MTHAVEKLLMSFDAMTDAEKHIAAVELLRRAWPEGIPELPHESLGRRRLILGAGCPRGCDVLVHFRTTTF